ncbi:hypothetical protein GCM10028820_13070 [Tessaracoccus terricola]
MSSSTTGRRRSLLAVLAAVLAIGLLPLGARADGRQLSDSFDTLTADWYPVAGNWSASDGAAVADAQPAERGYSLALKGWRLDGDGSVTTTFTLAGQAADSSWGGVHLHREGLTDDYALSGYTALVRRNGELAIIKALDGRNVEYLGRIATAARPATEPVTLTFSASGEALVASVAGTTLEASDSEFRGGGVSLVAHRDSSVAFDEVTVDGLVAADDSIPLPADCVVPSAEGIGDARGPVLNSDARVNEVTARVQAGVQPQAAAFELLQQDLEADLLRTPAAPETFFVPWFYNDPDAHRAARDGLQNDANAAYRLALAYRITGEESYGTKAAAFLDDWSGVGCLRTSEDSALAFSYHFPAMVFAAELLRESAVWPEAAEQRFAAMIGGQALEVAESITGGDNNWASWGVAASAAISSYLADEDSLQSALTRSEELVELQISPEGYLTHEVTRNNGVGDYGIWYSHFSLFPNLLTAEIAAQNGWDLFSVENSAGVTQGDAVEVLAGWVDDVDTFPFYEGADKSKLANVRTIDYLRADGVIAHSMSYFEIARNHYDIEVVDKLVEEEGPMTTIHSAPHLTLTHGSLPEPDPNTEPTDPPETEEPTPTPTVTVTVTAEPLPTTSPTTAPAPGDVYSTPGFHRVNGRDWMTACEPYSQTTRCWTYIWATQVQSQGGRFVGVTGWAFNNLTYLPELPRSAWRENPLGTSGEWTAADGRKWRTECDTAATGRNGCRNYVSARVVAAERTGAGWSYEVVEKWVMNSIVRFA